MAVTEFHSVCPHDCPDTCAFVTRVEDGRAVEVRGHPDHAVTRGWLCAKVNPYLDRVYHPERLLHPMRRRGAKGSGEWERISWDEALAEITGRWRAIIDRHGGEAILPYSYSGTLGLVQMHVANARLWNRLGASRLLRTICGVAAEHAVRVTLGKRLSPPYEHVLDARLVIIWGHNPHSTAPHFMPFLRRARRNGTFVVVVDPRRTRTARTADLHLAPRPGTDAALALALANVMVEEELHDEKWLARHALGWETLRERVRGYTPQRVAGICGLDQEDIVSLARRYASTRPALIRIADGVNRNRNGGQSVRAICTLPALTGQYGVRGGGLMYSTGDSMSWDREALHRRENCPSPGRKVNMNRLGAALTGEITDPPIQSLFVYGANPAAISPNAALIDRGLRREDLFTVVHELFMTDTAALADIVLPATSQLEHVDLHTAYGHTHIAYNHPAIDPPGECRSNWQVMQSLAEAMGVDDAAMHESPDEIIDTLLRATSHNEPALAGIDLPRLKREGSIALSLPHDVPFADGRFPTPSGRVELFSETLAAQGTDPLPGWKPVDDDGAAPDWAGADAGIELVSAAAHHFISSSMANQRGLVRLEHEPLLDLNPRDAATRGIADGSMVRVENSRGWFEVRVRITSDVPVGVAATPKGWWCRHGGGRNVNWTTSDVLGDMAGQSTFQTNRIWLKPA